MSAVVYKQRPMIEARVKIGNTDAIIKYRGFTRLENNVINYFYEQLQTRYLNENNLLFENNSFDFMTNDKDTFEFYFDEVDLKKRACIAGESATYVEDIIKSLKSNEVYLPNIIIEREIDGIKKKAKLSHTTSIVLEVTRDTTIAKRPILKVKFSRLFIMLTSRQYNIAMGNYVPLQVERLARYSGLTTRFIEYIYSLGRNTNIVRLNEERLETICNKMPKFSNYKTKIASAIKDGKDEVLSEIVEYNSKLRFIEVKIVEWRVSDIDDLKRLIIDRYNGKPFCKYKNINYFVEGKRIIGADDFEVRDMLLTVLDNYDTLKDLIREAKPILLVTRGE